MSPRCPGGHCRESCWLLLIFFNQSVGSIACYINRQVGTLNAINHCNQRCHGTLDPQQQIVIKMLWYQWGIVCKQSNVQIALLNFSLCYEWFNFYNPLLFSLHPTSLSKWKSQLIISTCPAMIQRSPGGRLQVAVRSPLADFPCLGCRQITPGSPSGVPTENGGCPCGHLWVFFRQLHPKFPRVAERRLAGDWLAGEGWQGTPADELICVTSADHPAKFNIELKCSGRRWMSKRWALQECLFGWRPPDFCWIWCKTHRTVIGRSIFHYCDVGLRELLCKHFGIIQLYLYLQNRVISIPRSSISSFMFLILPFSGASWFTVFEIVFGYLQIAWYVRFLILCILANVS